MAHFAGAKIAACLRFDVDLEQRRQDLGNFSNWCAFAAADIDGNSVNLASLRGEQIGPRNIVDEREIACLFAIFIKHWRQIVEQSSAKNCDHAGVWVEDRLAWPVGARVTEGEG